MKFDTLFALIPFIPLKSLDGNSWVSELTRIMGIWVYYEFCALLVLNPEGYLVWLSLRSSFGMLSND